MNPNRFDGIFTALVTPFTDAGQIDWTAFDRLIDRQLEAGISGLVPVGTTGEAATLSDDEALSVISHVVRRAKGHAYVMAGTGSNVTTKAVTASRRAADVGVDGVLLITPYYNKPSQNGLKAHYAAIATAIDVDIMLYSVPGRTGIGIETETAATLSRAHPNIVAIKEAGGSVERVSALRSACGLGFAIHSGDDALALPFLSAGARGVTSVLSNYLPQECVALYRAWAAGHHEEALAIHERLLPVATVMFVESNPCPVKRALALDGLIHDAVRLPLVQISPRSEQALRHALTTYREQSTAQSI